VPARPFLPKPRPICLGRGLLDRMTRTGFASELLEGPVFFGADSAGRAAHRREHRRGRGAVPHQPRPNDVVCDGLRGSIAMMMGDGNDRVTLSQSGGGGGDTCLNISVSRRCPPTSPWAMATTGST
jgi:hypothetical protein